MPELPEDVLLLIFEHFHTRRSRPLPKDAEAVLSWQVAVDSASHDQLSSFALVNKTWNRAAERLLYHTVFLRQHRVVCIDALLEAVVRDPNKAANVRRLRIRATRKLHTGTERTGCPSDAVINAIRRLELADDRRSHLIEDLQLGEWDAKFVALLCLCPNVQAMQLRDFGSSCRSLLIDILADAVHFRTPLTDADAFTLRMRMLQKPCKACDSDLTPCLQHLRVVRGAWKGHYKSWGGALFGGTVVLSSNDGALLAMPVAFDYGALETALRVLPRLSNLKFLDTNYDEREDRLDAQRYKAGLRRSRKWIQVDFDWYRITDILCASPVSHLESLLLLHNSRRTKPEQIVLKALQRMSSLQDLEIYRDLLYCCGGTVCLRKKLCPSLRMLRIRHEPTRWKYGPDLNQAPRYWGGAFTEKYQLKHDLQLLDIMRDPQFARLCRVEVFVYREMVDADRLARLAFFSAELAKSSWRVMLKETHFLMWRDSKDTDMPQLPDEILLKIFGYFHTRHCKPLPNDGQAALSWSITADTESHAALCTFARVNKTWNRIAEPLLYHTVFLRPRHVVCINALLDGLVRNPHRAANTVRLRIRMLRELHDKTERTGPPSTAVMDALKALPLATDRQQRLMDRIQRGDWDAKFAALICLCPSVQAVQLRDFQCSNQSILIDILADAAHFRIAPSMVIPGPQECSTSDNTLALDTAASRSPQCLQHLQVVRAGWKSRSLARFGPTVVMSSSGGAILALPVVYEHGALMKALHLLPHLSNLQFLDTASRRRLDRATRASEKPEACQPRRRPRGQGHFAWNVIRDALDRSPVAHLTGISFPAKNDIFELRPVVLKTLPRLSSLRDLEIQRELLYVYGRRVTLRDKLSTSLTSLCIRHDLKSYEYRMRYPKVLFTETFVEQHDRQLLNLLWDPAYTQLRTVAVYPYPQREHEQNLARLAFFSAELEGSPWQAEFNDTHFLLWRDGEASPMMTTRHGPCW